MKKVIIFIALTLSYESFSMVVKPEVSKLIKERDEKIEQVQKKANIEQLQKQLAEAQNQAQPVINALMTGLDTLKKNPITYKKAIPLVEEAIDIVSAANNVTNQKKKLNSALYNIQNEISKVRQSYNADILKLKKQQK